MRLPLSAVATTALLALAACTPGSASPPPVTAAPPPAPISVSGTVVDDRGAPAEGALVALIPPFELQESEASTPTPTVLSVAGGRFAFGPVPEGRYGVTATAPGKTAAYGGVVEIGKAAKSGPVQLKLGGPGFELKGTVSDSRGALLAGALVRAVRLVEDEGYVLATRTDASGRYALSLPPGAAFYLLADTPGLPRWYRRFDPVAATLDAHLDPPPAPRPTDEALRSWLGSSALPLAGSTPGATTADLAPLKTMIGDARLVGLGEATHNSAEFFQLKHRVLQYLVEELGFRVFAIEAGWSDALALNDYVVRGQGDAAEALHKLITWEWETEEVLAMVRWMRRYNEDPAHKTKLEFQGFDIVTPAATAAVLAYLATADTEALPAVTAMLSPFRSPNGDESWGRPGVHDALAALVARFDDHRAGYVARTSEEAFTAARHHALQILLAQEEFVDETRRDRHMADNVAWLVDHHPPGTRTVLWAHNAHIAAQRIDTSELGALLRERYGAGYFALGFAFDHGGFNALDWRKDRRAGKPSPFSVGSPPPGSFDAALGLADKPLFLVDLRAAPPAVRAWLSSPTPAWLVRGWFATEKQAQARIAPARCFDAAIYVREISPAHALR